MKWNYIFAGLLCLVSGSSFSVTIDVNDPDTLVIDSVVNWDIFSDSSNNYNNILITQNGVLNIFGTASTPSLILNSAAHIEINGSINIQDVAVTLNAPDSFFLTGNITGNADISIQSSSISLFEVSSVVDGSVNTVTLSANTDVMIIDQNVFAGGVITSGGVIIMSNGTIVPLPASLWLMLTGLLAFFQIRKKPSNRNKHITPL